MTYDPSLYNRHSIRLPHYDYSQNGAYFVTLVCRNREPLFENERYKAIVEEAWQWLDTQYVYVNLDKSIVMPNHLHGIILIYDHEGGSRAAPTDAIIHKPLGQLIGAFKTLSTKHINALRSTPGAPVWQRNYYEHIIRGEDELDRVREYIANNPLHWDENPENPNICL
jgi:REP element-mobilizing transposase RayT